MLQQQDRWIWPFELTEKIGEGGMGVVYKARYVVNDRPVAVKMVPNDVTDETILARFEREVEILKSLRHPNIVLSFGGVCEDKRRFYAMEFIEGGTLEDLLKKRGRLPWELVVDYGKQICSALAYAHERGIIHRDLKPANFLITGDGRLKLSDFGLATLIAGRKITAAGRTAGTYEYMSPEQISGKEMSGRSDLYSLGCVLYELLTGRPPFDGIHAAEILQKHLKSPPPRVAADVPDCPANLDRLVADLLEKSADQRPQTAQDVAEILRMVTPTIRVESGAPTTGVSSRPTPAAAKARGMAAETTPASRAAIVPMPVWLPLALIAVLGGLTAGMLSYRDRTNSLSRAEEQWIQAFREGDLNLRLRAASALGEFGDRSTPAYETLVAGLEDPQPTIRAASATALGQCGNVARACIPTLIKLQRDDQDMNVRAQVGTALQKIRASSAPYSAARWAVILTLVAEGVAAIWLWRSRSGMPAAAKS